MSADPTAANRAAVGNFLTGLLPSGSPLKKSIEASKAEAKAAELEAQAQAQRAKAAEEIAAQEAAMMSQGAPAEIAPVPIKQADRLPATQSVMPSQVPSPLPYSSQFLSPGLAAEAKSQEQLGSDQAALLRSQQETLLAREAQSEEKRKEQERAINDQVAKISAMKIEPKSFWEGKSTGQKIAAGIGLFFASFTPQGTQNAIKIIDNEIERDLMAQKANLAKEQNTLSNLEKQLGSIDAAETAFRLKSMQMLDLKLKEAESTAKGPMARAQALKGQEMLSLKMAELQKDLMLKLQEKQDKLSEREFEVAGMQVRASSTKEAAQLKAYASNAVDTLGDIEKLKKISREGATMSPEAKALVMGIKGKLQGQYTAKDLDNLIPDPSKLTTLSSRTIKALDTIAEDVRGSLENRLKPSLVNKPSQAGIKNFEKYRVK
jgi:hypothetical protein